MATINKEKLIEIVSNIPKVAKSDNWIFTRDIDEGTMFYSPDPISNETELYQITDEYALYLDRNLNPKGVVIEYYNNNFMEHHPEFKEITIDVFGDQGKEGEVKIDPSKVADPKVKYFKSIFENTIIAEAIMEPISE